jgi:hypothetical protein
MPRLESSMLTGRTLAVVPVTDNDPLDAVLLVVTGDIRDGTVLAVERVLDLVGLAVLSVNGTDQHVVGDVVQMSTVLQPGTGHGDVIGGGLALSLDKNGEVGGVLAVPGVKRLEELQTVGGGGDGNGDGRAVRRWVLVGVLSWVVSIGGQTHTGWRLELELLAVAAGEFIFGWIEVQSASNSHGNDKVGRCDEGVGGGVGIVTTGEVTVVGRDDRIGLTLLDVCAVPLSDTRTKVKLVYGHIKTR